MGLNHSSSQQRLDQQFYVLTLNFEIPRVAYFWLKIYAQYSFGQYWFRKNKILNEVSSGFPSLWSQTVRILYNMVQISGSIFTVLCVVCFFKISDENVFWIKLKMLPHKRLCPIVPAISLGSNPCVRLSVRTSKWTKSKNSFGHFFFSH